MKILKYNKFRLSRRKGIPNNILRVVGEIIRDVRTRGNAAILDYT